MDGLLYNLTRIMGKLTRVAQICCARAVKGLKRVILDDIVQVLQRVVITAYLIATITNTYRWHLLTISEERQNRPSWCLQLLSHYSAILLRAGHNAIGQADRVIQAKVVIRCGVGAGEATKGCVGVHLKGKGNSSINSFSGHRSPACVANYSRKHH